MSDYINLLEQEIMIEGFASSISKFKNSFTKLKDIKFDDPLKMKKQDIKSLLNIITPFMSKIKKVDTKKTSKQIESVTRQIMKKDGMTDNEISSIYAMFTKAIIALGIFGATLSSLVIGVGWFIMLLIYMEHKSSGKGGQKSFIVVFREYLYGSLAKWVKYKDTTKKERSGLSMAVILSIVIPLIPILIIAAAGATSGILLTAGVVASVGAYMAGIYLIFFTIFIYCKLVISDLNDKNK